MFRRFLFVAIAAFALPFAATAQLGPPQDRYIVVLNEGLDLPEDVAADVAIRTGGRVGYVYETVLRGFSITMPRAALAGVQNDPRVAFIEEDKPVSIFTQNLPTGIDRIDAESVTDGSTALIDNNDDLRVDVDIAILDTGIDFDHPDLYVVGGTNCLESSGGPPWARTNTCGTDPLQADDDHYHGTHVAGTSAAIDNGIGVVGVAPGARLYAVKVLDQNGSGSFSGIVAGVDWVVAQGDIEIINMSLGGSGSSDSLDTAITNAVSNGVTVVVAAGNSDADAANYTPANSPDAITVSALADFDGVGGGLGEPTCRTDEDDTLANFSNWGTTIDIAAPGVCILSTYPIEQGEYATISGTSMASPHVAGAAALLASNGNGPAEIRTTFDNMSNAGWTDDSGDGEKEPLLNVDGFTAATVSGGGESGDGDTNSPPTASFTFTCTDLACDFDGTGSSDSDGSISSYDWGFGDNNTSTGSTVSHTYASGGTYSVTLTVTDDDGATDNEIVDVTVSESSDAPISLNVSAYKVRGTQHADLTWSRATSAEVDVYRDSLLLDGMPIANDGAYTDITGQKGGGSATYEVCEAGTTTCSAVVTANW